ncbi:MAG: hypothetical protein SPL43_04310 [Prevotella sp.]|nr:hypothetical protein [Prevotella sp.]
MGKTKLLSSFLPFLMYMRNIMKYQAKVRQVVGIGFKNLQKPAQTPLFVQECLLFLSFYLQT